jgi:hypothetical protein
MWKKGEDNCETILPSLRLEDTTIRSCFEQIAVANAFPWHAAGDISRHSSTMT